MIKEPLFCEQQFASFLESVIVSLRLFTSSKKFNT